MLSFHFGIVQWFISVYSVLLQHLLLHGAVAYRASVFSPAPLGTALEIKLQDYIRISLINKLAPPTCCKARTVTWEPLGTVPFRMRVLLAPGGAFGGVEVTSENEQHLVSLQSTLVSSLCDDRAAWPGVECFAPNKSDPCMTNLRFLGT